MRAVRQFNVVPAIPPVARPRSPSWRPTSTGPGIARRSTCSPDSTPTAGRSRDTTRCACSRSSSPSGGRSSSDDELDRHGDRSGRSAVWRRRSTGHRWFQGRGRLAAAPRRLLLARVRPHRDPAAVQRRPRRARRRPPEGGERPRRPARRDRAALRRGLLPPAPQRRRLPGGAVPPARPERAGAARHRASRSSSTSAGDDRQGPGVAGRRSAACTLYLLDTHVEGNSPDGVDDHRPPLRRRRRAPAAPGDRARHRRRQGAARARPAPRGVPHQRGPRRVPVVRADARAGRPTGLTVRRGRRGGARRRRVHHAHARAGRHRPVRAVADGEVLRSLRHARSASTSRR